MSWFWENSPYREGNLLTAAVEREDMGAMGLDSIMKGG